MREEREREGGRAYLEPALVLQWVQVRLLLRQLLKFWVIAEADTPRSFGEGELGEDLAEEGHRHQLEELEEGLGGGAVADGESGANGDDSRDTCGHGRGPEDHEAPHGGALEKYGSFRALRLANGPDPVAEEEERESVCAGEWAGSIREVTGESRLAESLT